MTSVESEKPFDIFFGRTGHHWGTPETRESQRFLGFFTLIFTVEIKRYVEVSVSSAIHKSHRSRKLFRMVLPNCGRSSLLHLFHTGFQFIEKPDITIDRRNADFGRGFYLSENKEFSRRWARERKGLTTYLNTYNVPGAGFGLLRIFSPLQPDRKQLARFPSACGRRTPPCCRRCGKGQIPRPRKTDSGAIPRSVFGTERGIFVPFPALFGHPVPAGTGRGNLRFQPAVQ